MFHPGWNDDVPYSWSEPYFQPHDGGLSENMTMCWQALVNVTDDQLGDGMVANHAVQTLARAKLKQPFFVAVGLLRPHV